MPTGSGVSLPSRFPPFLTEFLQRWRRPTRRELLWALAALPTLLLAYTLLLIPFTPAISDIRKAKVDLPAQVLSSDGKLLTEFKWANRVWVPLKDVAPSVVNALVATEDHRFYEHFGLDWRRTASAALHTFSGERQGGSTLTQQLARNLFPQEIGRAPTLTRKLKEAITAFKIEALYTKPEILETYLNTVPFLYNAYGIEMAARTYFDKSADQLSVLESATLVGMLKGNSYYNPVLNPERALQRRNTVLAQMVKRGQLDAAQYTSLSKRPLRIDFERQVEDSGPVPHFAVQLRKWLIDWADDHDYNLYADGLVVHTTIDARLQTLANQALARQSRHLQTLADAAWQPRRAWGPDSALVQTLVRETPEFRRAVEAGQNADDVLKALLKDSSFMGQLRTQKTRLQAGFLALDPRNGQVRAWVGSRDFANEPFDHVSQARRQPGSTFKPFVYGAAFDKGASPDDTLIDQAVEIPLPGGEVWRPSDGGPPSDKPMRLRDALAYSKNTITAQLMQSVGPERVARLARAMGVNESPLEAVPALALGTSPVSLKEMVSAYSSIAHDGQYLAPMLVTRIENRQGEVLAEFAPAKPQRALSAQANYQLLDAMRGVVDKGTGVAIRSRYGIRADVAGKTGTTQDNTDGWFILMHPQLVAGAWVGFNDGRITLRSDYWGQGAHSALPIVGDVTAQALRSKLIDSRVRFETPPEGFFSQLAKGLRDWAQGLMAPEPTPVPQPVRQPAPIPDEEVVVEEPAVPASEPVEVVASTVTLPASAPVSPISASSAAPTLGPVAPVSVPAPAVVPDDAVR
ncbi:transglycosylase domain-containing protein [Rhodoferax sp. BLA1]|uniref:penicillin-binding protein 1A n=1 Tax=Rhodoferax sp. BLA1 TaxID=2576062 RepID=UPI0015D278D8